MEDEKICPHCGETVKIAASKCRYCGEWIKHDLSRLLVSGGVLKFFVVWIVIFIVMVISLKILIPIPINFVQKDLMAFRPDLRIISHFSRQRDNTISVFGTVENIGSKAWNRVVIRADYFDSDGLFIDQTNRVIWGPIQPSEKENFEVTFVRDRREDFARYDHYAVKIDGADE